jgi:hypothetical protein
VAAASGLRAGHPCKLKLSLSCGYSAAVIFALSGAVGLRQTAMLVASCMHARGVVHYQQNNTHDLVC